MGRIEKTIFVSYRRTNASWALAIFQDLTHHGYDVFLDFNGIASGDFERAILENIRARAHFLVLLTPSALERCRDPGDWLRREIEAALDSRRNVVPLMLEGFDFDTLGIASQLTGKLTVLKSYNALHVPADYFAAAMDRLRDKYLSVPLDAVLHPSSPSAQRAAMEQRAAAKTAPAVRNEELTAEQWFERGFNAADADEQLRFYGQAIRLKPDYADAFNNRGVVRRANGDVEGALQDYNEAIRLNPDLDIAFTNRGIARHGKGDLEGALQDYNEAIRLNPDNVLALTNRSIALREVGDLEGMLQDYNEVIRLKPDDPLIFTVRGIARRNKGDLEGALQDYNEAIRLNPDNARPFLHRSFARQAKGDVKGALEDYNEAIRLGYKPKN